MPSASRRTPPTDEEWHELDLERKLDQVSDLTRRMVRAVKVPEDNTELTPTQLVVLSLLDEGPMRIGVLASAAMSAQNTISEVVARLTRAGLVAKHPDPKDRRAVLVGATDRGRQALESRRQLMREYHRGVLRALTPADRQRFIDALEVLVNMSELARVEMTKSNKRALRRNDS